MHPRVFVSSVIDGFKEYREAARDGILASGGEPVLIEDYPALSVSPRTACLDGVASSDIFIIFVGGRGGWIAPSGKLVVEEEYEEAKRCKRRVLAFIQNAERDEEAKHLVKKVSDYVNGVLRPTFTNPDELRSAVEEALAPIMNHNFNQEFDLRLIEEKLANPYEIYNEASLRFVLSPERIEEFIDPVSLESQELKDQFFRIGHSPKVELFSYERPKKAEVGINEIVILQSEEGGRRGNADEVRLELTTAGTIILDINVTGRAEKVRDEEFASFLVVMEDDITSALRRSFAFARMLFEWKDPFKRYDRMLHNSALSGLGYRTLMKQPPRGSSCPMGQHGDKIIIAFDQPRLITREDLLDSNKEIQATLTLFRRRLK